MQGQYIVHKVSSKLNLILFETLTNQQNRFDLSRPDYILRQRESQAQLLLVDEQFKFIKQTLELKILPQITCFSFIKSETHALATFAAQNQIKFMRINNQSSQINQQKIVVSMEKSDYFVFLSNSIQLNNCYIMVAISKSNRFYLVIIKKESTLEVVKLNNLQDVYGIHKLFNWFDKNSKIIFEKVHMYLLKLDKYQKFLSLMVVRDNNVTYHNIELKLAEKASSIALINHAKDLSSLVSAQCKLKSCIFKHYHTVEFRQLDIFLAYETEDSTIDVYKVHVDQIGKDCFTSSLLLTQLQSVDFDMTYFNDYLYYRFFNQSKQRYQIVRNQICWIEDKEHLKLLDCNPFMICCHKPIFRKANEKMLIIEKDIIYSIEMDEEQSDFSYEQRKWLAFRDTITKIYAKKINSIANFNILDLIMMLNEKQKKMTVWLKRQKSSLSEDDSHVIEILGVDIVGIIVLKVIANEFYKMGNSTQKRDLGFTKKDLFQVASSSQVNQIIGLLAQISQNNETQLFLKIIYQINHLQIESYYLEAAKTLFQQPFKIFAQKFEKQQLTELAFQRLVQQIARLKILERSNLQYFLQRGKDRFVREIIVINKLEDLFIDLFATNQVKFTQENLRSLLGLIKNESVQKLKHFVCALLKRCKSEQSKDKDFLFRKIQVLVDGMVDFHEYVFYEIDGLIPGLNFFLLMKSGNRRKVLHLLASNPYFQQLRNKNILYMFVEDLFKGKDKDLDKRMSMLYTTIFEEDSIYQKIKYKQTEKQRSFYNRQQNNLEVESQEKQPSKKIKF